MNNKQIETMKSNHGHNDLMHTGASCGHVPEFTRLAYFHGQMLGARDLQTEQSYFREKLKLHNRCLHGYGTVCGLKVIPEPSEPECEPQNTVALSKLEARLADLKRKIKEAEQGGNHDLAKSLRAEAEGIIRELERVSKGSHMTETPTRVRIEHGLALDCEGNELVVRYPLSVDLWQEMSPDDRKRVKPEGQTLYLSICYCPLPVDPVRPVLLDLCGASSECVHGKVRDAIRVTVTVDPPKEDERCETCCGPCEEACLLLARITGFKPGQPLSDGQIENHARRMIGTYPFTTITGINWTHGAEYTAHEAKNILGTNDPNGGIVIRFSKPVLTETITRGVVDLWVIEGGGGRRANIYNMEGDYVNLPTPTTTWVRFRQTSDETLQEGDRVLITVRTCFILDTCCRPVDGAHVGGRVPILPDYEENDRSETYGACVHPPLRFGSWTSGSGTPGGAFESWFFVKPPGSETKHGHRPHDQRRYS
jgi:hypothetical protein